MKLIWQIIFFFLLYFHFSYLWIVHVKDMLFRNTFLGANSLVIIALKNHQASTEKKHLYGAHGLNCYRTTSQIKMIYFCLKCITDLFRNCSFLALALFSRQAAFPTSKETTGPHGADHSTDLLPESDCDCVHVFVYFFKSTISFEQLHHFSHYCCFYCCIKQ